MDSNTKRAGHAPMKFSKFGDSCLKQHSSPSRGFTAGRDRSLALEGYQRCLGGLRVDFEQSEIPLGQPKPMFVGAGVTGRKRHQDARLAVTVVEAGNLTREHRSLVAMEPASRLGWFTADSYTEVNMRYRMFTNRGTQLGVGCNMTQNQSLHSLHARDSR